MSKAKWERRDKKLAKRRHGMRVHGKGTVRVHNDLLQARKEEQNV